MLYVLIFLYGLHGYRCYQWPRYQRYAGYALGWCGWVVLWSLISIEWAPLLAVLTMWYGRQLALMPPQVTVMGRGTHPVLVTGDCHWSSLTTDDVFDDLTFIYAQHKCECLIFTGDIVDGPINEVLRRKLAVFSKNKKIAFITGNHDEDNDDKHQWLSVFSNLGWHRLSEQNMIIGSTCLQGIDYHENNKNIDGDIVFQHVPYQHNSASFFINGHTHGGQMWPFTLWYKWRYAYVHGCYHDTCSRYVHAGLGVGGSLIRLMVSPEVVIYMVE